MPGGGVGVSSRVATTTIEEWAKKVSEETERHLPLIGLLKKKGRIEYGCSGGQFRWIVRNDDHTLQQFEDMVPVNIARVDTKTSATLPWRGYYVSDAITLREKLEQGGPEAMIKIFANREELMRRGAIRRLAQEMFKDGNLAINSNAFHGIESMMGIAAQTNTDELATTHNDTYAGLSTAVGTVSSEFTRLWTPVIVNTGKVVSGSTQAWSDFGDEYIRKGLIKATHGSGSEDRPDLVLLTQSSYEQLLNLLDDKERIVVDRGSGLALTQLGFGNHVEIDGCAVTWGAEVPTTDASPYGEDGVTVNGYAFNTNRMKLKVLGSPGSKNLFTARVDFNTSYRADEIFMHLLGNLQFESPRHFVKLANIASVAS
jgi:hypothetical protein